MSAVGAATHTIEFEVTGELVQNRVMVLVGFLSQLSLQCKCWRYKMNTVLEVSAYLDFEAKRCRNEYKSDATS